MPNNVDITAGTGTTISTTTVGSGFSAYSTSGQAATGILYCSANTSTAPTPVTNANPLPVSFQNSSLAVTQSGTWNVTNISGTISLPTGAATAAKQPALGTAGTASSDVLTVQGVASMTPLSVSQSGTWTVSATQSGTWSSRLQDGSGNAVTSRVTGSSRPLEIAVVDASGNQITSFGGSGGTASNYGSTFPTSGTAAGFSDGTNMVGARTFDLDSGAGTQNVLGVGLRIAASGGSVEGGTSSNPIRTDPTGTTTQPVSLASVPLPTGAATAAKQPALGTAGAASTDVITVQGIASGVAQPVSQSGTWNITNVSGTVSLPTGASTESSLAKLTISQSTALGSNTQTMVGGSVTTSAPSYTTGNINPLSLATTGHLRTIDSSSATDGGTQPTNFLGIAGRTSTTMRPIAADFVSIGKYAMSVSVAGVNGALGQGVSSVSFPVVIASDQSVIPVSQDSATLYAGTTALTPKFAAISASSSGDNTVVAAVTSKKIRVIRFSLSSSGTVNAKWKSGAGTDLTGLFYMVANGGAGANYTPVGLFETASNTALVLNLSGATAVGGMLTYVEVA